VGVNINASGPFLGPYLADFLRAGPEFTATTLSRFYAIHMLLIPGALAALIGLHLYLVVRLGVTSPPWSKEAAGTGPLNGAAGNGKATRAGLSRFRRGR
jgi:quinol-cytochrome oxidoreductase complex cytochrome b subunit